MLLRSASGGRITTAAALLRGGGPAGGSLAGGGQAGRPPATPREPLTIEQACPGREQAVRAGPADARCWLVCRSLTEAAPDCAEIATRFRNVLCGARQDFDELKASAALCRAANMGPEDVLFMDTETCGLAGSAIFLVGLMFFRPPAGQGGPAELVFEQYLARSYAEEPAILAAFAGQLGSTGVLVTFNGKAFDMNMIRERCAFHGIDLPDVPPHLDLLHESRRRWRGQVPNCRLQTLESLLCGRRRVGDIPGADIPQEYHRFVKTGNARGMRDILHHNLLDLLTLAELLCAIMTGCDPLP